MTTLECGCIVTLTSVRIEHSSLERTRRILCPHGNEVDFLTKAGEYDLSVEGIWKEVPGTIESRLNILVEGENNGGSSST